MESLPRGEFERLPVRRALGLLWEMMLVLTEDATTRQQASESHEQRIRALERR